MPIKPHPLDISWSILDTLNASLARWVEVGDETVPGGKDHPDFGRLAPGLRHDHGTVSWPRKARGGTGPPEMTFLARSVPELKPHKRHEKWLSLKVLKGRYKYVISHGGVSTLTSIYVCQFFYFLLYSIFLYGFMKTYVQGVLSSLTIEYTGIWPKACLQNPFE